MKHQTDCTTCGGFGYIEVSFCKLDCDHENCSSASHDCDVCNGTGKVESDPLNCDCYDCCYVASFVCDSDSTKVERHTSHDVAVARAAVLAERTGRTHSVWHSDECVFTAFSGEELHSREAA